MPQTEQQPTVESPIPAPVTRGDEAIHDRVEQNLARVETALEQERRADESAQKPDHGVLDRVRQAAEPAGAVRLKVSVLMPVYNEIGTVREIVRRVRAEGRHEELLIVDDCSTDGTRDVLIEIDRECDDVRVVLHGYNRGKGAALRTAIAQARGEIVLVQDADLEYDPSDYGALLEPIQRGEADVVYGSRFLENAEQDPSRIHRWGNRALTEASNLTTGLRLTDMETCYKAIRRDALRGMSLREDRFGFEPEITAKLARRGCRFREVPIRYHGRGWDEGKKIGARDGLRALWCLLRYAWLD